MAGGILGAAAYPAVKAAVVISYAGVVLLALAGFARRDRSPVVAWIGLFALYWAALHVLAVATSRYRLPLMPLLRVPAACWLARPGWPEAGRRRTAVGVAAALFLVLCVHYGMTVLP